MSIISKETWDNMSQEEKEKILKDYKDLLSDNGYWREDFTSEERSGAIQQTEWFFGIENLQPKPLTYEDVAKIVEDTDIRELSNKYYAIWKLLIVSKYLNGDWKPDWSDSEEKKFFPSLINNEIRIGYVMRDNSFPVYFRTEELAKQAIQILGEDIIRLALRDY